MTHTIPTIKTSDKFDFFTSIWIVPIVALFIASWLAYQYYDELGPEIKITFPSNQGLKAGQSLVKYKDVPIGKVTKITLESEGEGVIVYVRMDKTATKYLNENSAFWIVKPEVTIGGVSGLDTLITGTYIGMYTKKGEESIRNFRGLNTPFREDSLGEYFHLNASESFNIKEGTPVYFKKIEVGKVEYRTLSLDGKSIDFFVFIESQYVSYIHTDSKFWMNSTLDADISNGHLNINIAPLTHLIQGGLSFSSSGQDASDSVPNLFVFHLFDNQAAAEKKLVSRGKHIYHNYEVHFPYSIAKLDNGASVVYQGYNVGEVIDTTTYYNASQHNVHGVVRLKIDMSFFQDINDTSQDGEINFKEAIDKGLAVALSPIDPISGSMRIDLQFADSNLTTLSRHYSYSNVALPVISEQPKDVIVRFGELIDKMDTLLISINQLVDSTKKPLIDSLKDFNQSMHDIKTLTSQKSFKKMPQTIEKTLKQLDTTLQKTQYLMESYSGESLKGQQLSQMMHAIAQTTEELNTLLKLLNRKPEALLLGDD